MFDGSHPCQPGKRRRLSFPLFIGPAVHSNRSLAETQTAPGIQQHPEATETWLTERSYFPFHGSAQPGPAQLRFCCRSHTLLEHFPPPFSRFVVFLPTLSSCLIPPSLATLTSSPQAPNTRPTATSQHNSLNLTTQSKHLMEQTRQQHKTRFRTLFLFPCLIPFLAPVGLPLTIQPNANPTATQQKPPIIHPPFPRPLHHTEVNQSVVIQHPPSSTPPLSPTTSIPSVF